MDQNVLVSIYCPDCRGQFDVEGEYIQEEEIIECDLCSAEMIVLEEDPIKLKLYCSDDDF